ncbi:MAG: hypothetical protein ACOWWH_04295 [Eubacteriaceae bacterium]
MKKKCLVIMAVMCIITIVVISPVHAAGSIIASKTFQSEGDTVKIVKSEKEQNVIQYDYYINGKLEDKVEVHEDKNYAISNGKIFKYEIIKEPEQIYQSELSSISTKYTLSWTKIRRRTINNVVWYRKANAVGRTVLSSIIAGAYHWSAYLATAWNVSGDILDKDPYAIADRIHQDTYAQYYGSYRMVKELLQTKRSGGSYSTIKTYTSYHY